MSRQGSILLIACLFIGGVFAQTPNHALNCAAPSQAVVGTEIPVTCTYIPGTSPSPTPATASPVKFTLRVQNSNAYIPASSDSSKSSIELTYFLGDVQKTFVMVSYAVDVSTSPVNVVTLTLDTNPLVPQTQTLPSTTLVKRQIAIHPITTVSLRPGQVSQPFTVRLTDTTGNSLAHNGITGFNQFGTPQAISLSVSAASWLTLSTSTLNINHGQSSAQFTVTVAQGNANVNQVGAITVSVGPNFFNNYQFSAGNTTNVLCQAASASGLNQVTGNGGTISIVSGLQTAPFYAFVDYTASPTQGTQDWATNINWLPVGGADYNFNPLPNDTSKYIFQDGNGNNLNWNRFYLTPNYGTGGSQQINLFAPGGQWPTPSASILALFGASFPQSIATVAVRPRDISAMNPSGTLQVGDTFNVGVSLQQPLDGTNTLDITVDSPGLLFQVGGVWVPNARISLNAGTSGGFIRARAVIPGTWTLTYNIDTASQTTGIHLFARAPKTTSFTINRPKVVVGDFPYVQYTGTDSQAFRVYLTGAPTQSLTVIPYHAHCVANPLALTFTPSSTLWTRFSLRCLNTVASGTNSGINHLIAFFLSGPDRYNYNSATTPVTEPANFDLGGSSSTYSTPRGARRATVYMYSDSLLGFPIETQRAISIYSPRAPDSSLTVALYATNGGILSATSVTLTPTQPNAVVYLSSSFPTSGQIGMILSGPDAHNYEVPAIGGVPFSTALRTVQVNRICTSAEIGAGLACGTANTTVNSGANPIPLNAADTFLTTFNFTLSAPSINGLTIQITNPNLVITPNPVTIAAGEMTASFTVQTGVAGLNHELFFSYSGAPDMYIYNSPTSGNSQLPVVLSQIATGKTSTAFPANSGVQVVVPVALIALLFMILALF